MRIHSTKDLRQMFLEQIAIETPEATAALSELRDAAKWQAEYRGSAEWLDFFLKSAFEQGQEHRDWVVRTFNETSPLQIEAPAAA
jgi:hypothetical protein